MADNPNATPQSMTTAQRAQAGASAATSWRQSFEVYLHRPVLIMLFLGFSAGLPLLLVFGTLSFWLAEVGITRSAIGFFSWVGITFSIKVFWAPIVDRVPLPVLTSLLGKRRSWMLLAQIGIAVGLAGMALTNPVTDIWHMVFFALLVAFSSATQDITIDAYRIEAADPEFQGAMAGTYQLGYRIGMIVAGAGALYIAEYASWIIAYLSMALLMSVGMITALIISEPKPRLAPRTNELEEDLANAVSSTLHLHGPVARFAGWFSGAVVAPFVDFFARMGMMGLVILLFIAVYRLSDITLGIMANPFYFDLGYSKKEVADVAKFYGVILTIVGALAGGVFVARLGILRTVLLGAVLVASTNLVFIALATQVPLLPVDDRTTRLLYLTATISADNFSAGLAGTAFIAYLSSLTNAAYTATQYALFSSLMTLPGKFIGGFSGVVVDTAGYPIFFSYAVVLGLPAIILTIVLMRHAAKQEAEEAASSPAAPAPSPALNKATAAAPDK